MRVLLSTALALSLAAGSASAARQAIHVRLDIHRSDDAGVPDLDATSSGTTAPPFWSWEQRWADLSLEEAQYCERVQDEPSFRSIIDAVCATRGAGGYAFYYQTANNRVLRNCNCSSYSGGIDGVDIGGVVARLPSVRCFAKNTTRSFADVVATFNQTSIKCRPSDFL